MDRLQVLPLRGVVYRWLSQPISCCSVWSLDHPFVLCASMVLALIVPQFPGLGNSLDCFLILHEGSSVNAYKEIWDSGMNVMILGECCESQVGS